MKSLLEYSDEQGAIHINNWNNREGKWDSIPESNGYVTICESDYGTIRMFLATQIHTHNLNSSVLRIAWLAYKHM
jgi:hypothetical protein